MCHLLLCKAVFHFCLHLVAVTHILFWVFIPLTLTFNLSVLSYIAFNPVPFSALMLPWHELIVIKTPQRHFVCQAFTTWTTAQGGASLRVQKMGNLPMRPFSLLSYVMEGRSSRISRISLIGVSSLGVLCKCNSDREGGGLWVHEVW